MDILVDSNVILDIVTEDTKRFSWSSQTVATYAETHTLVINRVSVTGISIRPEYDLMGSEHEK